MHSHHSNTIHQYTLPLPQLYAMVSVSVERRGGRGILSGTAPPDPNQMSLSTTSGVGLKGRWDEEDEDQAHTKERKHQAAAAGCLLDLSSMQQGPLWRAPNSVVAIGTAGHLDPMLLRRSMPTCGDVLPFTIALEHVTTLDLRRNFLTRLPDALDPVGRSLLANLQTLILRGNSLKRIPPSWLGGERGDDGGGGGSGGDGECAWTSSLDYVDLRLNKLDTLPSCVGALSSLSTLLVSNNRLTSVPPSIARCVNLRQLSLGNNRLTNLPAGIGRLPRLEALFVNANALTFTPLLPPRLVSLDVSGNCLEALFCLDAETGGTRGFDNCEGEDEPPQPPPTLRDVYAVGNRISRLDPRAFAGAARDTLERLYLGSNALNDEGVGAAGWAALGKLRALAALDLSGNLGVKTVHQELDALWSARGSYDKTVCCGNCGKGKDGRDGCGGSSCGNNLRVLDLRGTGVTEAAFAAACPSLMTAANDREHVSDFGGGGNDGDSSISDSHTSGSSRSSGGDGGDRDGGSIVNVLITGGVGGCYGAFGGGARGGGSSSGATGGGGGGDLDPSLGWPGGLAPGEQPPLEHQLAPLTTVELQTRLRWGVLATPNPYEDVRPRQEEARDSKICGMRAWLKC